MGRDLSEGHVHALERQLVLAKAALEDMRRAYLQLEDVTQQLDNEAEDLQAQVKAKTAFDDRTGHHRGAVMQVVGLL